MFFDKFLAQQLGNPTGFVGRWVAAPMWNKRNIALNDTALENLALSPRDSVLEVGFGGGYLLGKMSKVVTEGLLAGVDGSQAMVDLCGRRYRALTNEGRLDLKCAKAECLPYPDAYFNQVCSVNSIFYWQDVPAALSEAWRVLAEGGALVLCFTCKESLEDKSFARQGLALFEDDEIQPMMESAGFHEIRTIRSSDRHRKFMCLIGHK
jgi:arsenite methyltransferase